MTVANDNDEWLVISAENRIPYGGIVTILQEAVRDKDKWSAPVFVWPSLHETVCLSRKEASGRNFVIRRVIRQAHGEFYHYAISTSNMEKESSRLELEIVGMLNSSLRSETLDEVNKRPGVSAEWTS